MTAPIFIDIGTSGLFSLETPFDTLMPVQIKFTCKGVRKLSEIIASGIDPFAKYYQPAGATNDRYAADLALDVGIISLTSDIGHWIYVPETCILKYPEVSGIEYTVMMIGASLGAIPNTLSLIALKISIANLIRDTLGVESVVRELAVSPVSIIDTIKSAQIETARLAVVSIHKSDRSLLSQANIDLAACRVKITELESYIASL